MKKIVVTLSYLLVVLLASIVVYSNELEVARTKKQSIEKQLDKIENEKNNIEKNLNYAISNRNSLSKKEDEIANYYNSTLAKLNNKNIEYRVLADNISVAKKNYDESLELFKSRLREMYKNSNKSNLDVLLRSKSLLEFQNRYKLMSYLGKQNKAVIEDFKSAKNDLEYKQKMVANEIDKFQANAQRYSSSLKKVKDSKDELNNKISDSKERLEQLEREEDEFLQRSRDLEHTIRNLISPDKKYIGGTMTWPCPSSRYVSSSYGIRYHPVLKYERMHTGIDIGGEYGSEIVAANSGTVKISEWQNGYGNIVVIDHGGGITTSYGHCSKLFVSVGEQVDAGQVIAKVGSSGLSTGPHLHFEVRKNGATTNPMNYY